MISSEVSEINPSKWRKMDQKTHIAKNWFVEQLKSSNIQPKANLVKILYDLTLKLCEDRVVQIETQSLLKVNSNYKS